MTQQDNTITRKCWVGQRIRLRKADKEKLEGLYGFPADIYFLGSLQQGDGTHVIFISLDTQRVKQKLWLNLGSQLPAPLQLEEDTILGMVNLTVNGNCLEVQ